MSLGWLLLNTAYVVYTASAIFKDILMLRVTLLGATFLYIAYGLAEPNWSVFFWNIPVATLHIYAIWELFKTRRSINLDEEAEALRALVFKDLDRVAFNALWHTGVKRIVSEGHVLITQGEPVPELFMILDGEVEVEVTNKLRVHLSQFRMVGEMSSLSGTTASATVTALGIVRMRVWDKDDLVSLGKRFPDVRVAMLQAMGHEVARKLN